MNLQGLELEDRLEALYLEELAPELEGLGELGKLKLGKKIKKFAQKVGKVVRKVAPVALGAGALFVGARAIGGALKRRKAARIAAPPPAAAPLPAAPPAPSIVEASQTALNIAQASGALPPTPPAPAAPAAAPRLLDVAAQVASSLLAQQGVPVQTPAAQTLVRETIAAQAAQAQPLAPVPPRRETAEAVEASAPFLDRRSLTIALGLAGAVGIAAAVASSRRRTRR